MNEIDPEILKEIIIGCVFYPDTVDVLDISDVSDVSDVSDEIYDWDGTQSSLVCLKTKIKDEKTKNILSLLSDKDVFDKLDTENINSIIIQNDMITSIHLKKNPKEYSKYSECLCIDVADLEDTFNLVKKAQNSVRKKYIKYSILSVLTTAGFFMWWNKK